MTRASLTSSPTRKFAGKEAPRRFATLIKRRANKKLGNTHTSPPNVAETIPFHPDRLPATTAATTVAKTCKRIALNICAIQGRATHRVAHGSNTKKATAELYNIGCNDVPMRTPAGPTSLCDFETPRPQCLTRSRSRLAIGHGSITHAHASTINASVAGFRRADPGRQTGSGSGPHLSCWYVSRPAPPIYPRALLADAARRGRAL